ncbi:MAG: isoprenylcysteine carboxylmethyltransferase family protein [candidate division SR1 bacterium]|nr:isoprenylcysteine carboxylmethyltransferase family protein [candidate division SR1 bacterium]
MKKIVTFFTGTIIFVVLPLIAWGIADWEGYFSNTERMLYSIVMIIMSILVVILIPNQGKGMGEGEKLMKKHKISLLALQIIPLCIILVSPIFDRYNIFTFGEYERTRILGIIFIVVGFIIMNWSAYALGKQFSIDVTIQKNHELIITGPYKRIRHPRYIGTILFFLGVAGVFNTIISIGIVVILTGFLIWRVYDEEKIMKTEFKDKREKYVKKSWKLLPFIW